MATLLDALKKSGLVSSTKAAQVEERRLAAERERERTFTSIANARADVDQERLDKQERFMRGAARETTQASSRVGTRQYFDRFKK